MTQIIFQNSSNATSLLQHSIKSGQKLNIHEYNEAVRKELNLAKEVQNDNDQFQSEDVIGNLPLSQKRVIERIVKGKASSWLSMMPVARDGYDLTAQQFRDQLGLRYGQECACRTL